jgi:hypothetical protein
LVGAAAIRAAPLTLSGPVPTLGQAPAAAGLVPGMAPPPADQAPAEPIRCDGCGAVLQAGDRRAIVQVTGPDPGESRDFGTYCPSCWKRLATAIEVLEELLERSGET